MNQSALTQRFGTPLSKGNSLGQSSSRNEASLPSGSVVQRILATTTTWYRRQSQRRQLSQLDLRQLNDMGISLEDRNKEAAKAFWEK